MKNSTLNALKIVIAGAALGMLSGCIVLSVYPFYTEKDLTFDAGMVGRWAKDGANNEFWQFADANGKYYHLVTTDDQQTNALDAHLFHLKKYQFLDLLSTNREELQMPAHLISKVSRTEDKMTLQFLDYGWLANLLETNPAVLRHIVVPQNYEDTNNGNMVYLTADTKDLQKFLLKHAEDTNAFNSNSEVDLKRVSQ